MMISDGYSWFAWWKSTTYSKKEHKYLVIFWKRPVTSYGFINKGIVVIQLCKIAYRDTLMRCNSTLAVSWGGYCCIMVLKWWYSCIHCTVVRQGCNEHCYPSQYSPEIPVVKCPHHVLWEVKCPQCSMISQVMIVHLFRSVLYIMNCLCFCSLKLGPKQCILDRLIIGVACLSMFSTYIST